MFEPVGALLAAPFFLVCPSFSASSCLSFLPPRPVCLRHDTIAKIVLDTVRQP